MYQRIGQSFEHLIDGQRIGMAWGVGRLWCPTVILLACGKVSEGTLGNLAKSWLEF